MSIPLYYISDNISVKIESYTQRKDEPYKNKNKLFIFPSETIWENLENRKSRPHTEWKKEVIPLVMDWLKKKMPNHYETLKDNKWGWRQNCGCSMCPCSPGFISDTDGNISIYVDIKIK